MSQFENPIYSLSVSHFIAVINFSREITEEALDAQPLDNCKPGALKSQGVRFIVMDFSKVSNLTFGAVPAFTRFQKAVRFHGMELRLCGMRDDLKQKLIRLGVIRNSELSPSIKEALILIARGVHATPIAPELEKKAS